VNDQIIDSHGTSTSAEDREPPLSAVELAALRADLQEQRLFRQEQLRQLSPAATTPADALPDRRATAQVEVRVQLAASARMVLADVEDALGRMDRGVSGSCRLCREPLARERLLIVPQARHCTRCQQVEEAGR
jgi:DnaK suppressor protein